MAIESGRCWVLWAMILHNVENGDWAYSRVIACQLERGHRGEHEHKSIFGEWSWFNRGAAQQE